ncbi:MAG: hypothetical protein HKM89_10460 [Gemmatimonadales bacterium]|nr:hypothetical protein [Gemmatimonadales bacterium]
MADQDRLGREWVPYPKDWESQAELRVLRAKPGEWDKLPTWRADMTRKGWQLLRVHSDSNELVAIFGKTRRAIPSRNRKE